MVTIKSYGEGTCLWCHREGKEGVDVVSEDRSFTGFLCFPDLKRLLRHDEPPVLVGRVRAPIVFLTSTHRFPPCRLPSRSPGS